MSEAELMNDQNDGFGAVRGGRMKKWKELTTDEKIERLGGLVANQERLIEHLQDKVDTLLNHGHDAQGRTCFYDNPLRRPLRGIREKGFLPDCGM